MSNPLQLSDFLVHSYNMGLYFVLLLILHHCLLLRSGDGVGSMNKVKLRRAQLVLAGIPRQYFTGPLSLAVGRCNKYWQWFRLPLGKKRRVLRSSVPCDQDCWNTGLSRLKAVAVNLSWPPSWHGLYTNLIGSNPCWVRGDKRPSSSDCCCLSATNNHTTSRVCRSDKFFFSHREAYLLSHSVSDLLYILHMKWL